jgi:hypothetical protein
MQYGDGAHLYQYVSSKPTISLDPKGLDRYIIEGVHTYILVDDWYWDKRKCCWRKYPWQHRFDFRADYHYGVGIGFCLVYGPGSIKYSKSMIPEPDTVTSIHKYNSTPWADKKMYIELLRQRINPPGYSLLYFNCWHWSWKNITKGLDAKPPKECFQKICK